LTDAAAGVPRFAAVVTLIASSAVGASAISECGHPVASAAVYSVVTSICLTYVYC